MKKTGMLLIIFCLSIYMAKEQNFNFDGHWIAFTSFDSKNENEEMKVKGRKMEFLQLLIESVNDQTGGMKESRKFIKLEIKKTIYKDADKKLGYMVVYNAESKKYDIVTFKILAADEIVSIGMKNTGDTEEEVINNFEKMIEEIIKSVSDTQKKINQEACYSMGLIYRKKARYEVLNQLPHAKVDTPEELIVVLDKMIDYCKNESGKVSKVKGYFALFNFLILLDRAAIKNNYNPYTIYKKIDQSTKQFDDDERVKTKIKELLSVSGME